MTEILMGVPKYSCGNCGKLLSRQRGLYRHLNKSMYSNNVSNNNTILEGSIGHGKTLTLEYIGREYKGNAIPTGNRHLRAGIPLPRLSAYRSAAI